MKVWTVQQCADDGGSEEISVFSSREKVYDFIYHELEFERDNEKEGRPEFAESFDIRFETYVNGLDEAFNSNKKTFSVNAFYCWWNVQETEVI